ncbi:MAG TPA: hypothetical protein PLB81_01045 [Deltaproteobacteria bacterium]|nr:hypothetical protein [Deltaproteobacteria bacterium]
MISNFKKSFISDRLDTGDLTPSFIRAGAGNAASALRPLPAFDSLAGGAGASDKIILKRTDAAWTYPYHLAACRGQLPGRSSHLDQERCAASTGRNLTPRS